MFPYRFIALTLAMTVAAFLAAQTAIAGPYIYPSKGQDKAQQDKDEFECYKWATDRSGHDPTKNTGTPAASAPPSGTRLRGAARGALAGALIGEIAGNDAGKGAAIGAGAGAVGSASRHRRGEAEAQADHQASQAQGQSEYDRAFAACLEGRGYTLK